MSHSFEHELDLAIAAASRAGGLSSTRIWRNNTNLLPNAGLCATLAL